MTASRTRAHRRRGGEPAGAARLPTDGPHVLVDPAAVDGRTCTVPADDGRHLVRALRRGVGDPVSVADGTGSVWQGAIDDLGPPLQVALGERVDLPPATPTLTVVHALPTGRKLDEVVRRLSELGVDRLQPVIASRCENRPTAKAAKARQRWQAVARAAAKQARRARPLAVDQVGSWPGVLGGATAGAVLWEEATAPFGQVLAGAEDADELVLGVGPEGGLTDAEVAAAAVPGAALGPTLLRTETASVAAAALALHHAGRLA